MNRRAEIVSHFLTPGGKFIFAEFHTVMWMFDNEFQTVGYNYFNSGPDIETSTGTYADPTSDIEITCAYWNHSTSEVLTSLLAQGLQLTQFQEFNYSPYACFKHAEEFESGKFRVKHFGNKVPLVFALEAVK